MTKTVSAARREWPFYVATMAFVLAALSVVWYLALLAPSADSLSLPTPRPEATYPPIPAVVPLSTYPADAAGMPIVVLATATATPVLPTPTTVAYQWPTATAVLDYSGDMDTGGR